MSKLTCLAAASIALTLAAPALAGGQTNPRVAEANRAILAQSATRAQIQSSANADSTALYAQDVAAYQAELRRNHRITLRDNVRAARQERAYADAMRAWRHQVYACHHGHTAACRAPAPSYADFY